MNFRQHKEVVHQFLSSLNIDIDTLRQHNRRRFHSDFIFLAKNSIRFRKVVAMFIPAVIKLTHLENFLSNRPAGSEDWARSLYVLGQTLGELEGVVVSGVAPDLKGWYLCFYVTFKEEKRVLETVQAALSMVARNSRCDIVKKARKFGRLSGHRRAVLRIQPGSALQIATVLKLVADIEAAQRPNCGRSRAIGQSEAEKVRVHVNGVQVGPFN